LRIPRGLEWWREEPDCAAWLERLPQLVAECAEQWSLTLDAPFEPAHISLVVPAQLSDGGEVVLKINFPEPESEHEADALAHWGGAGAALLVASDPERGALVEERCRPGTELWDVADEKEANRVAGDLLRRLWRPLGSGHPFRPLELEAARWVEELPGRWEGFGRPFERPLLDEAVSFLAAAGPKQGEQVVLHEDFHGATCCAPSGSPGSSSTQSRSRASASSTRPPCSATAATSWSATPIRAGASAGVSTPSPRSSSSTGSA
jgi:streptomycin 6-kinase